MNRSQHTATSAPTSAARRETIDRQIAEAVAAVRRRYSAAPIAGIVLGTGLGRLAEQVEVEAEFDYAALPHFPRTTALSHRGRLLCGRLGNAPVAVMDGRCHFYEGHSFDALALPVRVIAALGARILLVSNAAGGLNPQFATGDVAAIEDHINLMAMPPGPRPCRREPDASQSFPLRPPRGAASPYDPALIELALGSARRENFAAHRGVYIGVSGPNYETRAEYRFFRRIGDLVGMSTVPEALTAAECGMRVLALSTVTNIARPDAPDVVDAEEVAAAAQNAAPKVAAIFRAVLASFAANGGLSQ